MCIDLWKSLNPFEQPSPLPFGQLALSTESPDHVNHTLHQQSRMNSSPANSYVSFHTALNLTTQGMLQFASSVYSDTLLGISLTALIHQPSKRQPFD